MMKYTNDSSEQFSNEDDLDIEIWVPYSDKWPGPTINKLFRARYGVRRFHAHKTFFVIYVYFWFLWDYEVYSIFISS